MHLSPILSILAKTSLYKDKKDELDTICSVFILDLTLYIVFYLISIMGFYFLMKWQSSQRKHSIC